MLDMDCRHLAVLTELVSLTEHGVEETSLVNVRASNACILPWNSSITGLDLMYTVICRTLPRPANGAVTYSDPTIPRDEGSTATYSCNTGYGLSGNSVRTCMASGWNGSNPVCRGKTVCMMCDTLNDGSTLQPSALTSLCLLME